MAKVLVVDDTLFIRRLIGNVLMSHGHEVVGEATNGLEAIEQYRQLQPDIVTLDMTMPELDGMGALRSILGEDPSARVIVCSALADKARVLEALRIGARGYVLKPVKPEKMMEAVERLLP